MDLRHLPPSAKSQNEANLDTREAATHLQINYLISHLICQYLSLFWMSPVLSRCHFQAGRATNEHPVDCNQGPSQGRHLGPWSGPINMDSQVVFPQGALSFDEEKLWRAFQIDASGVVLVVEAGEFKFFLFLLNELVNFPLVFGMQVQKFDRHALAHVFRYFSIFIRPGNPALDLNRFGPVGHVKQHRELMSQFQRVLNLDERPFLALVQVFSRFPVILPKFNLHRYVRLFGLIHYRILKEDDLRTHPWDFVSR